MGEEHLHLKIEGEGDVKTLNLITSNGLNAREKVPYTYQDKHITSPAVYLTKRKPAIEDTIVTYDIRQRRIVVRTASIPGEGENSSLQTIVSGLLVVNPDLKDVKVNQKAKFGLEEMKDHIKLNKRFFQSEKEYAELLKNLLSFEGETSTKSKQKSDNQGNASVSVDIKTKTAFNPYFTLRMPLFDDFPDQNIQVELCYFVHQHGGVDFWFLSDDLQEMLDKETDRIIKEELEKINKLEYLILH